MKVEEEEEEEEEGYPTIEILEELFINFFVFEEEEEGVGIIGGDIGN